MAAAAAANITAPTPLSMFEPTGTNMQKRVRKKKANKQIVDDTRPIMHIILFIFSPFMRFWPAGYIFLSKSFVRMSIF